MILDTIIRMVYLRNCNPRGTIVCSSVAPCYYRSLSSSHTMHLYFWCYLEEQKGKLGLSSEEGCIARRKRDDYNFGADLAI